MVVESFSRHVATVDATDAIRAVFEEDGTDDSTPDLVACRRVVVYGRHCPAVCGCLGDVVAGETDDTGRPHRAEQLSTGRSVVVAVRTGGRSPVGT